MDITKSAASNLDDLFDRQCNYLYAEDDEDSSHAGEPVYPTIKPRDYPVFYDGYHKYSMLFGLRDIRTFFEFGQLVARNENFFRYEVLIPVTCDEFDVYFHEPRAPRYFYENTCPEDAEYFYIYEDRWIHQRIVQKGASACRLT